MIDGWQFVFDNCDINIFMFIGFFVILMLSIYTCIYLFYTMIDSIEMMLSENWQELSPHREHSPEQER